MSKLIDGYLVDDLIVYRGLQKGGHIGRGFRVYPPDAENADVGWLNHLEDELRVLLASLKDSSRMQFHWSVDSDYQKELLAYYANSKQRASNPWSRRQRDERFTRYWKLMEQRKLRRERLHIYVTSKIDSGTLPKGDKDTNISKSRGRHHRYGSLLDSSARELDQYGELLDQIFGGLGGSARPLDELGHFEEFYRYFNASAPDCAELDYATLYDSERSLIDNCFNGEAAPLSKPDQGFYLDGYYHGILAVKSLPKTTVSGMIGQLTGLDMLDYSITVNIRPLDVMREIEKEEGAYEKLQNTIQHSPKLRMLAAMQKKGQKISRLMSNEVLPYQAQFILRCWDQDKAGLTRQAGDPAQCHCQAGRRPVLRSRLANQCTQLLLRRRPRLVLGQVRRLLALHRGRQPRQSAAGIRHPHGRPGRCRSHLRRRQRQPGRHQDLRRIRRDPKPPSTASCSA